MKSNLTNFLITTLAYLLIYAVVYLIHINYFKVDVILYAAVFDAVISVFILAITCFLLKIYKNHSKLETFQTYVIFFLIGYSISLSLPAVIDRSLSFYILEKINTHNGSVNLSSMNDIFTNDYMDEYKLIEIRITEQLASGTITIKDGCINLTSKGEFIADSSSFFRKNFLAKKRLILDEYSDALTDPLRDSVINENYLCN